MLLVPPLLTFKPLSIPSSTTLLAVLLLVLVVVLLLMLPVQLLQVFQLPDLLSLVALLLVVLPSLATSSSWRGRGAHALMPPSVPGGVLVLLLMVLPGRGYWRGGDDGRVADGW